MAPPRPPAPPPRPQAGGVLIWQRVGTGSSAEVCEWWRSGIKGAAAAERTVAGSAAALVGSFSPSRRNTPKVRPGSEASHPARNLSGPEPPEASETRLREET